MLRPRHGFQSALSYPFSVISPLVSLSLSSLSLSLWIAQTAAHTVMIPPTLSLSLSLSLSLPLSLPAPHWVFQLWLLFVHTKTKPTVGRMHIPDRKWGDIDLSSLSVSHTHTHPDARGSNVYHNSTNHHNRQTQHFPFPPSLSLSLIKG